MVVALPVIAWCRDLRFRLKRALPGGGAPAMFKKIGDAVVREPGLLAARGWCKQCQAWRMVPGRMSMLIDCNSK